MNGGRYKVRTCGHYDVNGRAAVDNQENSTLTSADRSPSVHTNQVHSWDNLGTGALPSPKKNAAPTEIRAAGSGLVVNNEGSLSPSNYGAPPADASGETGSPHANENPEIGPRAAWLAAIRDDPAMTPTAFRLAVILSSEMARNNGGAAKPTLRLLGRCIGMTRKSVYNHLRRLREAGYLERLGGGVGVPHVYVMQFPNGEVRS